MAINWNKVGKDLSGFFVTNTKPYKISSAIVDRYSTNSSKNKTSTTKKNEANINNTYDTSDYVNSLIGQGATGGSGGYYTLDISGMLNAYNQQAASDQATAKLNYDTARNDLLTSLKRYQDQYNTSREDLTTSFNRYKDQYNTSRNDLATALNRYKEENALDRQNQQKAYTSDQAALEAAVQQADRQNRISAAARGLGGSGLQQLAQLQTLLSQGQTVSDMATQNQSVMDALKKALIQKEEDTNNSLEKLRKEYVAKEEDTNRAMEALRKDYANKEADVNTGLDKLLASYNNTLNNISAQLARNKAEAEMARANSYVRPSGGSSGITAAEASSYGSDIAGQLSTIVRNYQTAKNGTSNTTTYAQSLNALDSLGLNQNSSLYKQAKNNLVSIYKSKHSGKAPKY